MVHSLKISNITQVFIDPDASDPIRESEEEIKNALPNVKLNYLEEQDLMHELLNSRSPEFLQQDKIRTPLGLTDFKPSMLIYTSGTTGLPKSAIMSWRKSSVGCQVFGHVLHMTNESTVFTAMPLFHSTAALLGACAIPVSYTHLDVYKRQTSTTLPDGTIGASLFTQVITFVDN